MGVEIREIACAWCGAPFFGDRRHKYCSEECADEAHREQARLRFRERYVEKHEQELARNVDYYYRNKEKINARTQAYYRAHIAELREYHRNRYHRLKEAATNV